VRVLLKTILVDDERPALRVLKRILEQYDYIDIVGEYTDVFEAIERIRNDWIDTIFLDVDMPKMKGVDAANKILKINNMIDIIFVTAYNNYAVDAFEFGATDYIMKPISKKRLDKTMQRILEKHTVKRTIDKLSVEAKTDYLTGLYNRRFMLEKIDGIIKYKNKNQCFSLIISDIDYFKRVNDIYGHNCGDFVIKSVSKLMLEIIRKEDILVRWGGEEFVIILPNTNLKETKIVAEKIRKEIENYKIHYDSFDFSITMTFGIASYDQEKAIEEIIDNADKALNEGKAKGKNCVVVANT
jgi:diguanylate cyclase (GGDEF)-like protein